MSVIATTLMPFVQMIGVVPNEKVRLKNIFSQRDQQNQYSTPHSIKTDSLHQSIYIEADLLKRRSLPLRRPTVYEASAMENFREIYLCLLYMSANEKDFIRSRLSYRRRWLFPFYRMHNLVYTQTVEHRPTCSLYEKDAWAPPIGRRTFERLHLSEPCHHQSNFYDISLTSIWGDIIFICATHSKQRFCPWIWLYFSHGSIIIINNRAAT